LGGFEEGIISLPKGGERLQEPLSLMKKLKKNFSGGKIGGGRKCKLGLGDSVCLEAARKSDGPGDASLSKGKLGRNFFGGGGRTT